MKTHPLNLVAAALLVCALPGLAQQRGAGARAPRNAAAPRPDTAPIDYPSDVTAVRDGQEQALDQAHSLEEKAQDARSQAAIDTVMKEMQRALDMLEVAKTSPEKLPAALAAEQAAYQALLKLAGREHEIAKMKGQKGAGQSQSQQSKRQLDQLEFKDSENRYEKEKQASSPKKKAEQKEQLQILNRLQELARRQQDVNERLNELQTALQEAKTEAEREEVRKRLKRLRDEEQQMLADVDELKQKMEKSDNQASMADERKQLDKTRDEVQKASESMQNGSVPQSLASATRAQRDLQNLRDDFRKKHSNEFSDQLKQMRQEARDLATKEDEIAKKLQDMDAPRQKSLRETGDRKGLATELAQQKSAVTNLLAEAAAISEQAESAEPLLSKQLYDTVRKTTLDNLDDTLAMSSDLLSKGFVPQASEAEKKARQGIEDLKHGVERAAESVLGDEAEALKLASKQLGELTDQINKELAQNQPGKGGATPNDKNSKGQGQQPGQGDPTQMAKNDAAQPGEKGEGKGQQPGEGKGEGQGQGQGQGQGGQGQLADAKQDGAQNPDGQNPGGPRQGGLRNSAQRGNRQAGANNAGGGGGYNGGYNNGGLDFLNGDRIGERVVANDALTGPITGNDYVQWSDRLREVEEMVDDPALRTRLAQAREQAQVLRNEFKRDRKKPDWAVMQRKISEPLAEVRNRVNEQLSRLESKDSLAPIDRDPVPARFSELVRKYYQELGKSE